MAGKTKEWLRSETDELIKIYRSKPELWDVRSKAYRDRINKRRAVMEISAKFCTSVEEINRKIHNLRNQFNSELKKTKKRKALSDDVYDSRWPYYKSLLFLQSSLICRSAVKIVPTNCAMDEIEVVKTEIESDNCDVSLQCTDSECTADEPGEQESHILSKNENKTEEGKPNHLLMPQALNVLNKEEDHYDIFGKYVASELRNLSSEYLRKKMKRKFQQVIVEINEEEERLCFAHTDCSNTC